jgi:hydroxyacylglutathione hydrolase
MTDIIVLPVLQDNYIFIIHDDARGLTCVVDPAEASPVLALLKERGWTLDYILNTHHHGDHVGGNLALKRETGCEIIGFSGDADRIPGIDRKVSDNEEIDLKGLRFTVMFVPGHTRGHVAYYAEELGAVFVGDTLFAMGCGRLFEGSPEQMWESLSRLVRLPEATKVYCAHEYTKANGRFALHVEGDNPALVRRMEAIAHQAITIPTSIAEEKATNPFVRAGTAERFAVLRRMKDQGVRN